MRIAGQLSFLRVNVICDDLVSFTSIFHFCSQFCMVRRDNTNWIKRNLFQRHVTVRANRNGITLPLSLEHLDRKPVRIMKKYLRSMAGLNENTKELCTVHVQALRNSV